MNPAEIDTLIRQIREGLAEAQATAGRLGAPAAGSVVPLTKDPSPDVRSLALTCLGAMGGSVASDAAVDALSDENDQVVAQALGVLRRWPPRGHEKELLGAYRDQQNPALRAQMPMVAGRLAPEVDPKPWLEFWKLESNPELREALMVALARMGDEGARAEFAKSLAAASGAAILQWMEYAEYMEDSWVVRHLLPLLDRKEEVIQLNPDGENKWPLRTCDLAARAIVRLTKAEVPFKIQRPSQFNDVELKEILRIGMGAAE